MHKNTNNENTLYNRILLLSRNKIFYTNFNLSDTFQNRIHLIFIHISFLFVKMKKSSDKEIYKAFYQSIFDLIFIKIELNMREIGYGDVTVNKKMKILVKIFYNILLNCEKFSEKTTIVKNEFLLKYLDEKTPKKMLNNQLLVKYFDEYEAFCIDLSSDSVLKGNLNFNYRK